MVWLSNHGHLKHGLVHQLTCKILTSLASARHPYADSKVNSVLRKFFFQFQEAIVKILKMRKKISNAALQTELVEILKNMFLPSKKMIKEQIEWLIEHKYMRRDDDNINQFSYMA